MDDSAMDFSAIMPHKEAKNKKKSGGFQSMNLSQPVLRAVLRKGYKVPTPIQRKAIPVIMEKQNVIAMARTGSGKTAAFLIPMFEKLKCRVAKSGARALIFSPTRELAMQTMKFTKELGLHTDLKTTLILGGEKIEDQFAAIHESPDIIIATPGRFLHLVVEMNLKLSSVEYVVLDEADRLFEMGFKEQLQEVLHRLSSERQTLLFSATLPKVLVEFVKAGIEDPVLIRLDVDHQISQNLKSSFLLCRNDDKSPILLHLLKNVIDLKKELTVVFMATKHHVEHMKDVLERADIPCSYTYSSLDQMARTINIAKFRNKKVNVLLVTDIAARGIDIPHLDNVINYNFPSKPKLYVHRVGRVARAGRSGRAFSLVSSDEMPYLLDLHLFLDKSVKFARVNMEDEDGVCGSVPQSIIDEEADLIQNWHKESVDLEGMLKVTKNAYQKYLKSRQAPASESIKRSKKMPFSSAETHPIFKGSVEHERDKFIAELKSWRPSLTIFEHGALAKTQARDIMIKKRQSHAMLMKEKVINQDETKEEIKNENQTYADENDLKEFSQNIRLNKNSSFKKSENKSFKDPKHYLSYVSSTHFKEKGLGLETNFQHQAAGAVLDLMGDDDDMAKQAKNAKRWDRKKKKFVGDSGNDKAKKMKTENGMWIPKSFKSDLYKKWQEKNKVKYQQNDSDNETDGHTGKNRFTNAKGWKKNNNGKSPKPPRREMKSKEEIIKARNRKERLTTHAKKKHILKANRKKNRK